MKQITVGKLVERINQNFQQPFLLKVSDQTSLESNITEPYINRPGLALTGYLERFTNNRIQIFGDPEMGYLQTLNKDLAYRRLDKIFKHNIPCIIVSKGNSIPYFMEHLANQNNIPLLKTYLSTDDIIKKLLFHLQRIFAPFTIEHSTFIDVFGIGVLLIGKSGVGKSECALDLIERGHRLVTDDSTRLTLVEENVLMGTSVSEDGFFMEIRGVGIIDIQRMFGIQAVETRKRVAMIVELIPYDPETNYDAISIERVDNRKFKTILKTNVPLIQLPVTPGKNMSVVVETAVLNYMLSLHGYNAAATFIKKQKSHLNKSSTDGRDHG